MDGLLRRLGDPLEGTSGVADDERELLSKIEARLSTRLVALSMTSATDFCASQERGEQVVYRNPTSMNRRPPLQPYKVYAFSFYVLKLF